MPRRDRGTGRTKRGEPVSAREPLLTKPALFTRSAYFPRVLLGMGREGAGGTKRRSTFVSVSLSGVCSLTCELPLCMQV